MRTQKKLAAIILALTFFGCSSSGEHIESEQKTPFPPGTAAPLTEPTGSTNPEKQAKTTEVVRARDKMLSEEHGGTNTAIAVARPVAALVDSVAVPQPAWNRESYDAIREHGFIKTDNDPLSTFSIDVDTASYSNVRRFIQQGVLPPVGAIRVEEMINYFSYDYPQPQNVHPFSVTTELGPCPWNTKHQLIRIGLKAKEIEAQKLPPSNLVFLIDVSGSMAAPNKLPLLKESMKMLVKQLDKEDRVSMVVYAGNDCVILHPTSGSEQDKIIAAINALGAGGSTHASSGIKTAYELAEQVFMPGGNNRIILASDGDFNVGITSRGALQQFIEEKRESGIYLTVLGYGMGNYHDDTMEILADKGNGNYAYIDNLLEAKKVLVKEMAGTMFALARDVKIQVEFNPILVGAYRLIGYENRALADEDFNDDKKDAGEIGVGHAVTALYEIIPAGAEDLPSVDPLKYQKTKSGGKDQYTDEILTVKLRYKPLGKDKSTSMTSVLKNKNVAADTTSDDFRFAASVAGFGMLLQDSDFKGTLDYAMVLDLAKKSKGTDEEGYRAEYIRLVEMSQLIAPQPVLGKPTTTRK